ncbi:hypothetical protein [Vibrio sp. CK2-1]|uniref:hypothetical protein n=1 Tax=Vibrio sp. CK2-1 TaxID=2912249 RepID=UPI001F25AE54|nr:hypothetical protein [Vibrio sp. CK2-1]MCF7352572.1 hypothetical protein [Vibrio sp. CK2-1]
MKLKPIVPLMSLIFAATLTGCNFDGSSDESEADDGGSGTVPTTLSSDAYWNIGGNAATLSGVSTYSEDLPNVHVFDGDKQYYYDDDADFGTYTVTTHALEQNAEAATLRFTHYHDNTSTEVDGEYQVSDGILTIDTGGSFGVLSASDKSDDSSIESAIGAANKEAGISFGNKVAQLLDTTTVDSGELRIKFADSSTDVGVETIVSGKVSFDLTYQLDEDTIQDATDSGDSVYISLFNPGGNTSSNDLHTEIILNKGEMEYRIIDDKLPVDGSFNEGEKLEVEISWSASDATLKINGTEYAIQSYNPNGGVSVFAIKLGDTSKTTPYELLIDNLKLYSNNSEKFTDNFEGYEEGHELSENPYNGSSFEATVINESTSSSDDSTDTGGETDNGTDTGGETDNGTDTGGETDNGTDTGGETDNGTDTGGETDNGTDTGGETDNGTDTGGETDNGTDTGGETDSGSVITEGFDSYNVGTHIEDTGSPWKSYNTIFDDSAAYTSIAMVSSDQSTTDNNSLLIEDLDGSKPYVVRDFSAGAATSGSVSLDVFVPSSNNKGVYINIGTDKSDSKRYFEMRLSSGSLYLEAGDKYIPENSDEEIDPDVKLQSVVPVDSWNTITLSWENGMVDVSVNGTLEHSMSQSETGLSSTLPTQLTLYTGDNGSTGTKAYFDNIKSDLF